ncbi:nuclear transport factor 2 family protein [Streptomyces sp. NPDC059009]|uniref:nuclear transport factor 2 family protein n=1 Tax=Streptomyces sp. NPDC059009 TaxID=3346694 RepID=UPI0036A40504
MSGNPPTGTGPFDGIDPKKFIAEFHASFHDDLVHTDEDAGAIVDRYHTPDVLQFADGHRMDRAKLIAHARPIRKTRPTGRMEVHEAFVDGDRIAARSTLHVAYPDKEPVKELALEICFFGQYAPDRRLRRAHMLTRVIPAEREE